MKRKQESQDLPPGSESEVYDNITTPRTKKIRGPGNKPGSKLGFNDPHIETFGSLSEFKSNMRLAEYALGRPMLTLRPKGPSRLYIRGILYWVQFKRQNDLDDLDRAIEFISRALSLTPVGDSNLPSRLTSLWMFHRDRLQRLDELDDIQKSIQYISRAVALTPDNHPSLPYRLSCLGVSYGDRFQRLCQPSDIKKSFKYISNALSLSPGRHFNFPDCLINLGLFHASQFRIQDPGQQIDLTKAIEYACRVINTTPEGQSHPPCLYRLLADIFLFQFRLTNDFQYVQDALYSFRKASQSPVGSPGLRLAFALKWAKLASSYISFDSIEAYQTAINLLPQFIWLGATPNQRYKGLEEAKNLAVEAASIAILYSNYSMALEWLEHARCVVWNQSLTLRYPLDRLYSLDPVLAGRLRAVSNLLYAGSLEPQTSRVVSSGPLSREPTGQQQHGLVKEYSDLLSQARRLPGLDCFLQPMTANDLVRAARDGPIVVINCHIDRCDALLILPGRSKIDRIPLPNFTGEKALHARSEIEASLTKKGIQEETTQRHKMARVLAGLWNNIVKPVLNFLGYLNAASTDNLPHITWCPTGAASFLPLHAAGDYDQLRSRAFDYAIHSYTPTLTALLASTPSILNRKSRVLGVGQVATPGLRRLPGTTKELSYVKLHTRNRAKYSQLIGKKATTATVLDAMEKHDWVHLACHARQDIEDPTKSGFYLHDGTLDLASINRRSFKQKGLAFLSACETATGYKRLPDEAVHLASGMLMAGYPSVIATMWSVLDNDAPLVANKVYDQLMKHRKVGNGEAGRALHIAVSELRATIGEQEFKRWVPYIHVGS